MFSFGLYLLLFARFVLLTLSIFLFAGKDIAQKHCCSNPKIPFLANKYLLKVSVSKPVKVNSRDCASLLTTCNMFKLCLSVFLVYYEYVFVYCDAFVFTIFDVFFVHMKQISHLDFHYLLPVLYWV